jgi:hypothetical protein
MDNSTSRAVNHAASKKATFPDTQPACIGPHPMSYDWINPGSNDDGLRDVRRHLGSFGNNP